MEFLAQNITIKNCPMNELVWSDSYTGEKKVFIVLSVVLNATSSPLTILLNALVILAIKTKPVTLQTNHYLLLGSLATADLLVGLVAQPSFIAGQILALESLTLERYCKAYSEMFFAFMIPLLASLYHLTVLSVERLVALKYSLEYRSIMTAPRLKAAIAFAWLFSVYPAILRVISKKTEDYVRVIGIPFAVVNNLTICYCHISMYFCIRRYENQIHSEQTFRQGSPDFIRDRKAAKTLTVMIVALVLCLSPSFFYLAAIHLFANSSSNAVNMFILSQPVVASFYLINSLCNPIICCYRSRKLRKAIVELLRTFF